MKKKSTALIFIKKLVESEPHKAAQTLEDLTPLESSKIIKLLPPDTAALCIENMPSNFAAPILEHLIPEPASSLFHKISHHTVANILRHFSEKSVKIVLPNLDHELAKIISEILTYPPESAGRMMQTDFLVFHKDTKVRDVINRLRNLAKKQVPTTYCYVTREENKLLGVLNMHDLVISQPDVLIENIMRTDVVKVSPFTNKEELISIFGDKHYMMIPVVDENSRIIGVVNTKDLIETTEDEATKDIQILFGASADEKVNSPINFKIKKRLPWLNINLLTAFIAAAVVAFFEDMISKIAVLAVFLPIIAGQGGNAGIQSLSVIIRGLVMREIKPGDALKPILTETAAGFINGVIIGLITAAAAWIWKKNAYLGLVVGIAMVVNMIAAGLAGAFIPITMKKMGFDPAHSSGIFLTTVTDVVGFFSFLGLAYLFQSKLL